MRVHIVSPGSISWDAAQACLTNEEKVLADRFRFSHDAIHWMACRASLRMILGHALHLAPHEVPIILSENGKPLLAPPYDHLHFNLSHCTNLAVIALCHNNPVGIDLELLDRGKDLLECTATFCHPAEISDLPIDMPARASQLLKIWTAKEAVLKAVGTGMSHPPEEVQILFKEPYGSAISESPLSGIEKQRLYELEHPALAGYRVMLSATCPPHFEKTI